MFRLKSTIRISGNLVKSGIRCSCLTIRQTSVTMEPIRGINVAPLLSHLCIKRNKPGSSIKRLPGTARASLRRVKRALAGGAAQKSYPSKDTWTDLAQVGSEHCLIYPCPLRRKDYLNQTCSTRSIRLSRSLRQISSCIST